MIPSGEYKRGAIPSLAKLLWTLFKHIHDDDKVCTLLRTFVNYILGCNCDKPVYYFRCIAI